MFQLEDQKREYIVNLEKLQQDKDDLNNRIKRLTEGNVLYQSRLLKHILLTVRMGKVLCRGHAISLLLEVRTNPF